MSTPNKIEDGAAVGAGCATDEAAAAAAEVDEAAFCDGANIAASVVCFSLGCLLTLTNSVFSVISLGSTSRSMSTAHASR